MATTKLQNTFLSTYKDDFRDSDNYHRVLFNSGRALQARELTQMQTIIQTEMERFARYMFKDGALLTSSLGSLNTDSTAVNYVKLNTTTYALPATPASLIGTEIQNDLASPVKARVMEVIEATGGDPATLIIKYLSAGDNDAIDANTPRIFAAGELLTTDEGTLEVAATNPTGTGSFISIPANEFFAGGHFVFVPKQSLVISKYNSLPTDTIGYIVNEQIITVDDDLALYDNTGSTPNLTSPGADRYRIRLTLSKESDVTANDTFIPLIRIKKGKLQVVQTSDTILARLGTTINTRTNDVSGNFVVSDKKSFNLTVENADSEGSLHLNISAGTAFVDGRRIDVPISRNNLTYNKPRSLTNDTTEITGENTSVNYGNYFLADSMYGLVSKLTAIEDDANVSSSINLYNKPNIAASATQIGTAKIRSLDETADNEFKIHAFEILMDSNGSGVTYNTTDIRSLGTDSANYANTVLYNSKTKIYAPDQSLAVFALPRVRPQNVSNIVMTVAETFTGTTNGAGELTLNTSDAAEEFNDLDQWILAYDTGGAIVTGLDGSVTAGGAGSNTVTINGLSNSQNVHVQAYVNITGQVKAKTKITTSETVSLTNGKFQLTKADVYQVNSITDDTTGEDILYKFSIDYGQRPNFYDVLRGTSNPVYSAPAGTITVNYDYFQHGAGDFFAINSYDLNDIPYRSLPLITDLTTKETYRIGSLLDFRPVKNSSGTGYTGSGSAIARLPRSGDIITSTVKYWMGRLDALYLQPDGSYGIASTNSTYNAEMPQIPTGCLPLHYIRLNPYVFDKTDLEHSKVPNTGYKMSDIRKIDERLRKVEELTTLSLAEMELQNINVVDAAGLTREKLGLTGDNFTNHGLSDVVGNYDNYKASLDVRYGVMRPMEVKRQVPLYYDSDASTNTIRMGDMILPKYTEEVLINQNVASQSETVNQFEIVKYIGDAKLDPKADHWTARRVLDNRSGNINIVIEDGDLSTYDTFIEYGEE